MPLKRFRQAKMSEVARLRLQPPCDFFQGRRPAFLPARKEGGLSIIAEYKRASPSRGVINEGIGPAEIACLYTAGGADAISVLTEKTYFGGELKFLDEIAQHTHLPLLRKDFLFDELQVHLNHHQ